ncbi:MAG: hypothetical protein GX542_04695 [Rhodococcus sp.]|nr:hypothetical protein [Rhodococcus sp. (in: high G+C Gram-positive bacteria)]
MADPHTAAVNIDAAEEPEYLLGTNSGHLTISTGLIITAGVILGVFAGLWTILAAAVIVAALWLLGHAIVHLVRNRPRIALPTPAVSPASTRHTQLPHAA